ncbi:MAG: MurR/RpiR family transcriptional regulator [Limnochordales bacterium]
MLSLLERFQSLQPRMSRNQRVIADYILHHPEDCAFLTARELGRRVGVSESTVVRFAAAVGFPGYPEMQRALQETLKQRLSTVERMQAGREAVRQLSDTLQAVWRNDVTNINRTFQNLSKEDFDRAVTMLAEARRTYVIGLRTSACVALLLTTALHYLGKDAVRVDLGIGDFWEKLDMAGPEDVVVGISVPRYTRWTMDMLRAVRQRQIPTIVLTDSPVSPLAAFADVTLPAMTDFNAFIESFAAPLSVVNALILGVALHDEARTMQALRQREALWRERQLYAELDYGSRGDGFGEEAQWERRLIPVQGRQHSRAAAQDGNAVSASKDENPRGG